MELSAKPRQRAVEEGCIWMKAGVVEYKLCNNHYDCTTCTYDRAMRTAAEKNRQIRAEGGEPAGKQANIISWQEAMRAKPANQRVCRHALTGRIAHRVCAYDFQCHACDFDQFLEDEWEIRIPIQLVDAPMVRGYKVPEGFYYHDGHAWAKIENGGRVRIGLDDFGGKLVGPLEKLELPQIGYEVNKNAASWSLYREGNEAKVLAPMNGIVVAVNPKIRKRPDLSFDEPYEEGWVMVIQAPELKKTVKDLHFGDEANTFIESESDALFRIVENEVGPLPADGGELVHDVFGNIPNLGWDNLTKTFFRS